MPLPDPIELFGRHLDLRPLRGRARGKVRCKFHPDKTASLSLDTSKGLFCCFGCGAQGGIKDFMALVGEEARYAPLRSSRPRAAAEPTWLEIALKIARERTRRFGGWTPMYFVSYMVRERTRMVDEARRVATTLGPDHPRVWRLLLQAARVEDEALGIEAVLDGLLEGGRLHLGDDVDFEIPVTGRRP